MESKEIAILDLSTLLEAFGEFNEDVIDTLKLFLKTISPQLNELRRRLDAGDRAAAAEVAHAAKGVANTTGALRLGRLCSDIDIALRQGDEALARQKLAGIPVVFAEVSAEIHKLMA